MGNETGKITVENRTPYKWTVCNNYQELVLPREYTTHNLGRGGTVFFPYFAPITLGTSFCIHVKYGHCSETDCYNKADLWYELNPNDYPHLTIQECGDQIHLVCNVNYTKKKSTCPNYGKLEDDARQREEERKREKEKEERRRQAQREQERRIEEQIKKEEQRRQAQREHERRIEERIKKEEQRRQAQREHERRIEEWIKKEERRRQAQREHERRIEERIKRESEISARTLSHANERLKQKQILRGQDLHQQTHIIQQPLEIYTLERDEAAATEEKFAELMLRYGITETKDSEDSLPNRMKGLQNELMVEYCRKHSLSSSCMFSLDAAVGYDTLPLSDRLSVLEAVLEVVLEESDDDYTDQLDRDFLLCVLEQLIDTHPSLAGKLLQNILCTDVQLSMQSKEILCQILFNNLWTPEDIAEFIRNISGKDDKQVFSILHLAQTYKLEYCTVITALKTPYPIRMLQYHVASERHKDANTILGELRDENIPENVLTILEDVLLYLEKELPKHASSSLRKTDVEDLKMMVKSLNFSNPDRDVLKRVLVKMSVAVRMCSTVTIQNDKKKTVIEGYLPRLAQLATLVVFLLPTSETHTGRLLEMGTGEGKSCVLAMLAAVHAIRGVKVDLVTSSPVLACRDLEEWKELYDMFGITSSVVPPPLNDSPPEKQADLIQDAYKNQVVYSTVGSFAADILRQEFEKKTIRGERLFEMVLVDEVDYMTLDNGVQITFLSHESSCLQHLEQVLASIWAMTSACRPIEIEEPGEIMWTTRVQTFHMAAMLAMIGFDTSDKFSPLEILLPGLELGFYSEEDFQTLKASINANDGTKENATACDETWKSIMAKTGVEQQYDLLSVLEMGMENKVAFNCYVYQSETRKAASFGEQKAETDQNVNMLLLENGKACEIMSETLLVEATVAELKSKIKYSKQCLSQADTEENTIVIPSFMEEYLENRLPLFVENALKAIQMTKGREYMVEKSLQAQGVDVSEKDQHMYHSIIPVDFQASGMLEKRKRWGDGLQQFLEMKHQLALSPLSNVTNYMSNRSFFKRYLSGKGIFGVSGTLGGDTDKCFLTRHYKTDCHAIPAHQRKKVTELPAVQVRGGSEEWMQRICDTVSKVSDRGQVVLVVCEDVNTANALHKKITAGTERPATMYTMSESHSIENQQFTEGEIIITTNLGGRGTDVKVTKKVNQHGGLFVILTYFPNNRRVEQQVFGRTGRKGTPGMVQLILNQYQLAEAYQGHSMEAMRELREEFESERISEMEKEKLVEIEMKEELFSTFCQFLTDFAKTYSTDKKADLLEVRVKDVPSYFQSYRTKMDYHPALNALKESWGVWLTLHTDQITTQNDINELKKDLIQHLENTSSKLSQGNSENFYDHIQQALGRTALHFQNKTKCDYGAKSYWEKASDSDNYYRAAALYNQAYVTINMAKKNYKTEARALLEKAEKAIDAYVLETSNTLSLVSMSITSDFEPHHSGCCNFQKQMQARMNIFQSWKRNISEILSILEGDGDVTTVDSTLYSLSSHDDRVSTSELSLCHNYGLAVVFSVKTKPRFSFDALICCFIGVAQVVAGVLICAFSSGSLSSFGLGLISEGVSDIISGVMGMINGTFSWASWALSKAISIGISLAGGGFRVMKRAFSSVKKAASEILNGTKSLRSVAGSALKSGKRLFSSTCTSLKSIASSINTKNVTSLCKSQAFKLNFKNASLYAVQEIAMQGASTIVNKCIDAGVQKSFKLAFQKKFKDSVYSKLKDNKDFVSAITDTISSAIPKAVLIKECGPYKIDKNLEKKIKGHIDLKLNCVISHLMTNCSEMHQIINISSQLWVKAAGEFQIKQKTDRYVKTLLKTADISTYIYKICSSIPTQHIIDSKFVPAFVQSMKENSPFGKYDKDGRDELEDVKRLTDELVNFISEGLSKAMLDCLSESASSICTEYITQRLNSAARTAAGNLLGRHETQSFLVNQQHRYNLKSAKKRRDESLSEREKTQLESYANYISDEQHPATALELHVLTKSNLLEGRGVCVTVVDGLGNLLTKETYPGTDPAAGNIRLVVTKTPQDPPKKKGILAKGIDWMMGKDIPHNGHVEIIRPDGSREAVNSENQNCLFHAVIQATTNDPENVVKQKAKELRSKVGEELLSKPGQYAEAVNIQTMFNRTYSSNKFKIQAGTRDPEKEYTEYRNYIETMTPEEVVDDYNLGEVGEYEELRDMQKPTPGVVEADHIPPKDTLNKACKLLQRNPEKATTLKKKNPEFYKMIRSMENDQNGTHQLCINTLHFDHQRALTSGNSKEARTCRRLKTNPILDGDVMKLLKLGFTMAHPQSSDSIRSELGIQRNFSNKSSGLPESSRNQYYKNAFTNLVDEYANRGFIDQNKREHLRNWVRDDQFLNRNTQEYREITEACRRSVQR